MSTHQGDGGVDVAAADCVEAVDQGEDHEPGHDGDAEDLGARVVAAWEHGEDEEEEEECGGPPLGQDGLHEGGVLHLGDEEVQVVLHGAELDEGGWGWVGEGKVQKRGGKQIRQPAHVRMPPAHSIEHPHKAIQAHTIASLQAGSWALSSYLVLGLHVRRESGRGCLHLGLVAGAAGRLDVRHEARRGGLDGGHRVLGWLVV